MSPTQTTVDTMIHFQVGREVDAKLRTNDSAATSTSWGHGFDPWVLVFF